MELTAASDCLAALGHDTRLAIYRMLVQAGADGMNAGVIGARLALAPATLSFHIAHLSRVGLIASRPDGRFIYYSADYSAMNELLGFLTDNCCQGESCAPGAVKVAAPK
ncbi:MAG TPA: metalloregulator ArsR/SmtB family transcription factor, partial [Rhodocyclaceae bacterium]|nr:metalloregulator ArsR/SmtB family transcription factor [Rhodocyclaceae bacterium]